MFGLLGAEIRPSVREWLHPAWFLEREPYRSYSEEATGLGGYDPSYQGRSLQIVHFVPIRRSDGFTSRNRRKDPAPPS